MEQVARGHWVRVTVRALPVASLFALCLAELALVRRATHSAFAYSLDDPYIHLALAENIARGSYGVNPGEVAAPSSSVLWPFLLAPFANTPWGEYAPLALCVLCALVTVEIVRRFAQLVFAPTTVKGELLVALASVSFAVATNAVGLAFSGMEHSLQIACVALGLYGALRVERGLAPPASSIPALALLPLVRYESVVLTAPLCAYFALAGHARQAARWCAASFAIGACFSLFLRSHGLFWLPTSVFAKAGLVDVPLSGRLATMVQRSWEEPRVALFFALTFVCAGLAIALRARGPRLIAACAAVATLGHTFAGNFGWFDRYEVYVFAADVMVLTWLLGDAARTLDTGRATRLALLAPLALVVLAGTYVVTPLRTPAAARNIFEQQKQMGRFVRDYYRKPVAVNDLGCVAYRNDGYVLDLVGLASKPALLARLREPTSGWKARLAREHGVGLAMIYDPGPGGVPDGWLPLGSLHLAGPLVSCYGDAVLFFATDAAAQAELTPLLAQFAASLPEGVRFVPRAADELELALPE